MFLRIWVLLGLLSLSWTTALHAETTPVRLFMADGQLKSHPVRVFINQDISEDMQPSLILTGSYAINTDPSIEPVKVKPMLIARQQLAEQQENGQLITVKGTLILFDLRHYPVPLYKTVVRLTPTLVWQDAVDGTKVAIGEREVYLSNTLPAFTIPFVIVFLIVLSIIALARLAKKPPIGFLCNEGVMSLSKTQVALWTLLIASMVLAYGLMRLEVPVIPNSLIALMGLSLATGAISYSQGEKAQNVSMLSVDENALAVRTPSLSDLVVDYSVKGQGNLSMTRAQMVFWTLFTSFLFVVKSILEGDLWDVPWELVALMGLSQVSYLAPKINVAPGQAPPPDKSSTENKPS